MATSRNKPLSSGAKRLQTVVASNTLSKAAAEQRRDALDETKSVKSRVAALDNITGFLGDKDTFKDVLKLVSDADNDPNLRYAALSAIQAAAFNTQGFEEFRTSYLAGLRKLRADADPEIRSRVLGLLARENDPSTQDALIKGLEEPDKALLTPEKALQLLGYNLHAGAYEVARRIADDPPNSLARREALRILATNSDSIGYFEGMLLDKTESTPMRQLAAHSLNQLAPDRLQQAARALAVDETEDTDVKSLSLVALANFGDVKQLQQDTVLQAHVAELKANPTYAGTPLQDAVDSFTQRCGT